MNNITKGKNHPAEIRRTMHLAAPVIIGQIAVFSMNFVDTVMSGRLPNKEVALAALGNLTALVWGVKNRERIYGAARQWCGRCREMPAAPFRGRYE